MTAIIITGYTKGYTRHKVDQVWNMPHGDFYRLRHNRNGYTSNSTIYRREQLRIFNGAECRNRQHSKFQRKPLVRVRMPA